MAQIDYILEGWQNFISKSEVTESEAKRKAEICATCPNLKKSILTAFINDELKEIQGMKCGLCGCPSSALLRSSKPCPDDPPRF